MQINVKQMMPSSWIQVEDNGQQSWTIKSLLLNNTVWAFHCSIH